MKSNTLSKTLIAAALAVCVVASPAAAQTNNQQQQSQLGLFSALLGPWAAGAAVGTTTKTFAWFTTKSVFSHNTYHINVLHKWHQVPQAKYNLTVKVNKLLPPKFKVPVRTDAHYNNVKTKHSRTTKSSNNMGKAVVGCIMGSAFGAITASMRKATAMGNPPRWRPQWEHERIVASGAEKKNELTNHEALRALGFCGLGSLTLRWDRDGNPI